MADLPDNTPIPKFHPPVIEDPIGEHAPGGIFGLGKDASRYVIQLRRFMRPSLINSNGADFVWPMGTEGLVVEGNAELATHKYIGDNATVVEVMHLDDRRIQMSGILPGNTAAKNMRQLLDVLTEKTPDKGKTLKLPGIFTNEQRVVMENYRFTRAEDDRTASIAYEVTFVRTGTGKKITKPNTTTPPKNPTTPRGKKPRGRGKPERYFVVKDGYRTLRAIAKKVYKDPDKWRRLFELNKAALATGAAWGTAQPPPMSKMPTVLLPLGFMVRY